MTSRGREDILFFSLVCSDSLTCALVSRIAKLHDTKIHYESESGKGTKVYFDMKAEALDEK